MLFWFLYYIILGFNNVRIIVVIVNITCTNNLGSG
ncbi:hypothetical protein ABIE17_003167 [Lelliottia nimipressuralis]